MLTTGEDSLAARLAKAPLGYWDVFMKVLQAALFWEVSNCVSFSTEDPLRGQKPLQTHWTSGMYPRRADANLCTCMKRTVCIVV